METELQCKRCGYKWYMRELWDYQKNRMKKRKQPVRCARCRSPLWNKPYQRKLSFDRMNEGSYAFVRPLPFISHDAGAVRSNQISVGVKSHRSANRPAKRRTGRAMAKRQTAHLRPAGEKAGLLKRAVIKTKGSK